MTTIAPQPTKHGYRRNNAPKPKEEADMFYVNQYKQEAKRGWIEEIDVPHKIVGSFGIVDESGHETKLVWKVNGHRDGKHGVQCSKVPMPEYHKQLFNDIFKKWDNKKYPDNREGK